MRLSASYLQNTLEWDIDHTGVFVLEHPKLFARAVWDLSGQCNGMDGEIVLSDGLKSVSLKKEVLLIRDLFEVDLNEKRIVNALYAELNNYANDEYALETQQMLGKINQYVNELLHECTLPVDYNALVNAEPLMKAMGVRLENAVDPMDRLLDYLYAAKMYLNLKLIILVNIRSYLLDEEYQELCRVIKMYGLHVLFLEPNQYNRNRNEHMLIVDSDRCELLFDD